MLTLFTEEWSWKQEWVRATYYHIKTYINKLQWHGSSPISSGLLRWMGRRYQREKRKSVAMTSSSSVDSSVSYVSKRKKFRTEKLDENVLKPDGTLFMQLDTTKCHLADKEKGHSRCSLHRWLGFETQRGITYCETCNVNICKTCFK